jgi:hypothetical protein
MSMLKWTCVVLLGVLATASASAAQLPHNIPAFCADALVVRSGHNLVLTNQTIPCLRVERNGRVWPSEGMDVRLGTVLIHGGTMDLRTTQSGSPVRNARITILDQPLDTAFDPEQFGTGILVVDGTFKLEGQQKTPFCRLKSEPLAGASTLLCDAPVENWVKGDRLALPDTRLLSDTERGASYRPQHEEPRICAVAGPSITLCDPLRFDHRGARNLDGVLEFLPHVANLSRTVVVRSENPEGTRGHMLFTGRADVDIRYALVEGLGRTTAEPLHCTLRTTGASEEPRICYPGTGPVTQIGKNQIGRYALHAHHLDGPSGLAAAAPQFRFEGVALTNSRKWPIAVHNSHYGLVKANVMFQWTGAAFMAEDGSESMNVIEDNFALVGRGGGGGRDGLGREGVGFYLRGPNNIVRRNIAANILPAVGDADSAYGFKYYLVYLSGQPSGTIPIPSGKGSTSRTPTNPFSLPVREFDGNEVYGATESGLTYWWIGTFGAGSVQTRTRSFLRNTRAWNLYNKGIFQYESSQVTIDGFTTRGVSLAYDGADYFADAAVLTRFDVEGPGTGIIFSTMTPTPTLLSDSRFRTAVGLYMRTIWTSNSQADYTSPRSVTVRDVRFLPTPSGQSRAIEMRFSSGPDPAKNLIARDELVVESSNLGAFRAYYPEQASSFIIPVTVRNADKTTRVVGAPSAGLTNGEAWAGRKIAIAGAVAPCTTTRPEVHGFVCALNPTTAPAR